MGSPPSHLSGVRLFPFSFTSRSSSEESTGEVVLASRSSCSCWARYWAGFCLASLAQWRSSRWSRGRLAYKNMADRRWDRQRLLLVSLPAESAVSTVEKHKLCRHIHASPCLPRVQYYKVLGSIHDQEWGVCPCQAPMPLLFSFLRTIQGAPVTPQSPETVEVLQEVKIHIPSMRKYWFSPQKRGVYKVLIVQLSSEKAPQHTWLYLGTCWSTRPLSWNLCQLLTSYDRLRGNSDTPWCNKIGGQFYKW